MIDTPKKVPILDAKFQKATGLHDWWRKMVSDIRFHDILAAVKRSRPYPPGHVAESAHAQTLIAGFKDGWEACIESLLSICDDVGEDKSQTEKHQSDPDLSDHETE